MSRPEKGDCLCPESPTRELRLSKDIAQSEIDTLGLANPLCDIAHEGNIAPAPAVVAVRPSDLKDGLDEEQAGRLKDGLDQR